MFHNNLPDQINNIYFTTYQQYNYGMNIFLYILQPVVSNNANLIILVEKVRIMAVKETEALPLTRLRKDLLSPYWFVIKFKYKRHLTILKSNNLLTQLVLHVSWYWLLPPHCWFIRDTLALNHTRRLQGVHTITAYNTKWFCHLLTCGQLWFEQLITRKDAIHSIYGRIPFYTNEIM